MNRDKEGNFSPLHLFWDNDDLMFFIPFFQTIHRGKNQGKLKKIYLMVVDFYLELRNHLEGEWRITDSFSSLKLCCLF